MISEKKIKRIVAESVNKFLLSESFKSPILKGIIMKNGGIESVSFDDFDTYSHTESYVGTINEITDEEFLYSATHVEEDEPIIYILCNNGEKLSIHVPHKYYLEKSKSSKSNMRNDYNSFRDDIDDFSGDRWGKASREYDDVRYANERTPRKKK